MSAMPGVFDGLRVLDLTTGIAGPMTTMLLADNGADVTRLVAPDAVPASRTGERVWHRGTRSAELDLDTAEGRAAFEALAATADVVVETCTPGTMEAWGLDHGSLATRNARLITCSITAYGRHVPFRDRPADDALVAARTGLLYDQKGRRGGAMEFIAGRPGPHPEFDGAAGMRRGADRPGPVFPRTPFPSIGAAYFATLGITAALRAREGTGAGQWVETSLLQGTLAAACLGWQRVEHPDAPLYWMWPIDARSVEGLFECADGRWVHHWTLRPSWVLASAEGDALDAATLDTTYRDDPDRVSMEPDGLLTGIFLHETLAAAFAKFPAAEWVRAAEAAGIGVALVRSPAEALSDESFVADGCVVEVDDPEVGAIRHVGSVLEFSATPGAVRGPTPRPGEHTAEVLAEAEAAGGATSAAPIDEPSDSLAHPLSGVRVIDLGLGVAGPFTGRVLADLGADVIKVHALHDTFWAGTHMGLGTNRGKRSISLNLKDPRGIAALERLIDGADVVTTNWRPGAAARLGLDDATLRARNPRVITCNTRGYEKGPRSDLPGTDQTAAALTGVEWEDGACDTGNPPVWSRSGMGDTGNAMLAAIAITAALYHRDRTGEGQAVSTSIVNAQLLHTSYAWVHGDGTAPDWGRVDVHQVGLSDWYRMFECADGRWVFVAARTDAERARFLDAVGVATSDAGALGPRLEARLRGEAAECWFDRLDAADVPVEIVDEEFCRRLFDDPIARSTGLIAETSAGSVGRFEDPGLLVNLSSTPPVLQRGPCMCGEHSRVLLRECGYSDTEIDELVDAGVLLDAPIAVTP